MELSLFGKKVFEFKSERSSMLTNPAYNQIRESKFLPDFMEGSSLYNELSNFVIAENPVTNKIEAIPVSEDKKRINLTPKGVFELKLLNDDSFKINTDLEYVEDQINTFKDKLGLVKSSEFDMQRGTNEIASILVRLENRKKYREFESFFSQFAYTTTTKVREVENKHKNIKLGQIAQFVADLPKDAVKVMKDYSKKTKDLCDKEAVFYIMADKKDFEKTEKRRDPILLAQSPFGHFWQILGAWDKEMMLLEEL